MSKGIEFFSRAVAVMVFVKLHINAKEIYIDLKEHGEYLNTKIRICIIDLVFRLKIRPLVVVSQFNPSFKTIAFKKE